MSSGAPPPAGASALDFFLNFESSGKWPDNLDAISHLKTAFYLRITGLLEAQTNLVSQVRKDAIYVQCEGFTFRGTIHHEPSLKLVEAAHGTLAARELRWRSSAGAKHTAALSALSRTHPAFGPSVRLAKRWLGCQLYSGEMPSGLVELLAAAAFTSASERPPASAACGFAHFLHTLATHEFASEPLILSFDQPITAEMKVAADAAFAAARAAAAAADADGTTDAAKPIAPPPTIWVGTDGEIGGAAGCAVGPSWQSMSRLRHLAAGALALLDRAYQMDSSALPQVVSAVGASPPPKDAAAAAAVAIDRANRALMSRAFDPPTDDFDLLLELDESQLPAANLSWRPAGVKGRRQSGASGPGSARRKSSLSAYANVNYGEIAYGIGEDPVAELVSRLTIAYGSLALFFYDGIGGRNIAVKWRPAAFLPGPLKAPSAQHRMLLDASPVGAEASWALPNVADVMAGMVEAGDGLILAARVPRSSQALRQ